MKRLKLYFGQNIQPWMWRIGDKIGKRWLRWQP